MRAIVFSDYAPPEKAEVKEVTNPTPGPNDVIIDVRAAGVGFVDGLVVQGLYQVKPPLPFTPGSEISGVIAEVGQDVKNLIMTFLEILR